MVTFSLFVSLRNSGKALKEQEDSEEAEVVESEDEPVPLKKAMGMLFRNKYWVMVLFFNLLLQITYTIANSTTAYYCKWIFGNDNLVGLMGGLGMIPTLIGFIASGKIIDKLGVKKTVLTCMALGVAANILKCFAPTNFIVFVIGSLLNSFSTIPVMCLFAVLTAMTVDYNQSGELTQRLSKEFDCPSDWITFSMGTSGDNTIFSEGKVLKDTVTIFVEWFDRGQEVKDAVAKILTEGYIS